jgi:hypothetical protein
VLETYLDHAATASWIDLSVGGNLVTEFHASVYRRR